MYWPRGRFVNIVPEIMAWALQPNNLLHMCMARRRYLRVGRIRHPERYGITRKYIIDFDEENTIMNAIAGQIRDGK